MKRFIFLLIVNQLAFYSLKAQWVTIPDANFANKLTQLFPACMNGNQMDTTCFDILNATTLNVKNSVIYDLSGIEFFDNLQILKCDSNYLSTLPDLPDNLTQLYCSVNQILQLPALPDSLVNFQCHYNQLTTLPLLPGSLGVLYCHSNQLTSLPTLPGSLAWLKCGNNQLNGLPVLPPLLWAMNCEQNQIDTLPTLPNSLTSLFCEYNQLSSLPVLPNTLLDLNCGFNSLSNLPTLPGSLTQLWCNDNQLSYLPTLPNSLTYLSCSSNQIGNLPLLPNSLTHLFCFENQLSSLPALPITLTVLLCYNNQLNSLPAVPNVMSRFRIENNNISCLINLPEIMYGWGSNPFYGNISNNQLSCVPNQTVYSLGLPFCLDGDSIFNPNNCPNVNISGNVFTDQNSNCGFDVSDLQTRNIPVKLYDSLNNFVAVSYTANGAYSFGSLNPDSFQVRIDLNSLPVVMDCGQPDVQSAPINAMNQSLFGIHFPVDCNQFDIAIQSVTQTGWVFPGQTHRLKTNITNNETWYNLDCGSSGYSGTVKIILPGIVNYLLPAPNALTPVVNGDTLNYFVTDFVALNPESFDVLITTDTSAQSGDQICVHIEISPNPMDANTNNNVYDFCYLVANSYDPNMKEVYPVNVLPGYDDWFTYTIHFQNTGNSPAFNIRLRDTLDTQLDVSTFEMLAYSHPALVSLNGNILTVRFNNIMLPDSTTDYEGSMGYFQYRIKPLPNLPNGSQIENTAYIYFDYNAPIVTNTTQNHFDLTVPLVTSSPNDFEFVIYPNPSNGIFSFKDTKNLLTLEVFNLVGERILTQSNQKEINLSHFSNGIYFAKINGQKVIKLVKE